MAKRKSNISKFVAYQAIIFIFPQTAYVSLLFVSNFKCMILADFRGEVYLCHIYRLVKLKYTKPTQKKFKNIQVNLVDFGTMLLLNISYLQLFISINPFSTTAIFIYPLKASGFVIFTGGIERDQ